MSGVRGVSIGDARMALLGKRRDVAFGVRGDEWASCEAYGTHKAEVHYLQE